MRRHNKEQVIAPSSVFMTGPPVRMLPINVCGIALWAGRNSGDNGPWDGTTTRGGPPAPARKPSSCQCLIADLLCCDYLQQGSRRGGLYAEGNRNRVQSGGSLNPSQASTWDVQRVKRADKSATD